MSELPLRIDRVDGCADGQPRLGDGVVHCSRSRTDGPLGEEEGDKVQKGGRRKVPVEEVLHDSRHLVNDKREYTNTACIYHGVYDSMDRR